MSVTYLATGAGMAGYTPGSPITFTDTVPTGASCTLIWVSNFGTTNYQFLRGTPKAESYTWTMYDTTWGLQPPPVSASIGSTPATLVAVDNVALDSWQPNHLYLYCFAAFSPPTGSQTVTFNGGANFTSVMTTVHYQGASQVKGIWGSGGSYPGDTGTFEEALTNPSWVYVNAVTTAASVSGATFTNVSANLRYLKAMKAGSNRPLLIRDAAGTGGNIDFYATETHPATGGFLTVALAP